MQVVACLSKLVSAFYRKNNPLFGEWVDDQAHEYYTICHDSSTSRYELVPIGLRISVVPF